MRAKSEAAKASSMAALLVRIESGNASIKRIESDFQPILIDLAEQDGLVRRNGELFELTIKGKREVEGR